MRSKRLVFPTLSVRRSPRNANTCRSPSATGLYRESSSNRSRAAWMRGSKSFQCCCCAVVGARRRSEARSSSSAEGLVRFLFAICQAGTATLENRRSDESSFFNRSVGFLSTRSTDILPRRRSKNMSDKALVRSRPELAQRLRSSPISSGPCQLRYWLLVMSEIK